MGFRFRKSIKIAPGIRLNIGKKSGSISVGPRGMKFTVGSKGARATVGIPGTGISYTTKIGTKNFHKKTTLPDALFKPPAMPDDEKAFIGGCSELAKGDEDAALEIFSNTIHLADGAFMAGVLFFKKGKDKNAENCLMVAERMEQELGQCFAKYEITPTLNIPITDEVFANVGANIQGVLLTMTELFQKQKRWQEAIECLKKLYELDPTDAVIRLSIAELMFEIQPNQQQTHNYILKLAEGIENDSLVHAALLLYKAKALSKLGSRDAALNILSSVIDSKSDKDYDKELLSAFHYERGLLYEDLGDQTRARVDFETIYSMDPVYEDVGKRLGL